MFHFGFVKWKKKSRKAKINLQAAFPIMLSLFGTHFWSANYFSPPNFQFWENSDFQKHVPEILKKVTYLLIVYLGTSYSFFMHLIQTYQLIDAVFLQNNIYTFRITAYSGIFQKYFLARFSAQKNLAREKKIQKSLLLIIKKKWKIDQTFW